MTLKNSQENKRRWRKMSAKKRAQAMSDLVKIRWAKTSKGQRKAYSLKMLQSKTAKATEEKASSTKRQLRA